MANPEHVEIVRAGAEAIAEWRLSNRRVKLDLRGAGLVGCNLAEANLAGANISTADLGFADLFKANLSRTNFVRTNLLRATLPLANFSYASLMEANLFACDLTLTKFPRANLSKADRSFAHLLGANLAGTKFSNAIFESTSVSDCDLSACTGLETVQHLGPSTVGTDTLVLSFRSGGNRLPPELEGFFRSSGVPEGLLRTVPTIVGAITYYTCFICYGQPDYSFALTLREELLKKGVTSWLYSMDATPGQRTWSEIQQKRREADRMIVLCSLQSLVRDGAKKEIEEQIDEDPDKILPVSLDDDWKQPGFQIMRGSRDLKPFLMDRNYADFSDLSKYDESLERLLKGVRRKDREDDNFPSPLVGEG